VGACPNTAGDIPRLARRHKRAQQTAEAAAADLAAAMTAAHDAGASLASIARQAGLCRQRVHQIVKRRG
jgi:lambda repressor-like predicted transcriptional regulator